MISRLIWKEWRQLWPQMAFGCLLLAGITSVGLKTRVVGDEEILHLGCIIGAFGLPIILLMELIAPERDERSLDMLLGMPIASRVVYWAKAGVGYLGCIVPLLANLLVFLMMGAGRELSVGEIWRSHIAYGALNALLFSWGLGLVARISDEAKAGLLVLLVPFIWGLMSLVSLALDELNYSEGFAYLWSPYMVGILAGSSSIPEKDEIPFGIALVVQTSIAAGILLRGSRRFGFAERSRT